MAVEQLGFRFLGVAEYSDMRWVTIWASESTEDPNLEPKSLPQIPVKQGDALYAMQVLP